MGLVAAIGLMAFCAPGDFVESCSVPEVAGLGRRSGGLQAPAAVPFAPFVRVLIGSSGAELRSEIESAVGVRFHRPPGWTGRRAG